MPALGRRRVITQDARREEHAVSARRAPALTGAGREEREPIGLGAVTALAERLLEDAHRRARAVGRIAQRPLGVGEVHAVDLEEAHEALRRDSARVEPALVPCERDEESPGAGLGALAGEERIGRRGLGERGGGLVVRRAPRGRGLQRDHQGEDPRGEHDDTGARGAEPRVCDGVRVRRKATHVGGRRTRRSGDGPKRAKKRKNPVQSSSPSSARISPLGPRRPSRAMSRWRNRRLTPASSAARVRLPSVRSSMART